MKSKQKKKKTHEEYLNVLKHESCKESPANCVFLPRNIRSKGRVFISTHPTFVSTNFFIFQADERRSRILASWFSTIFYQLECEAYRNNRSGARKLEKKDFDLLHVPITSNLTGEEIQHIISTPINEFLNLRSPQAREIDIVWAKILFGENAEKMIDEAITLISILVADREK